MSWVSPQDVRARWPGAPADDTLLQAWIDDAETILRAEYPWIEEWLTIDPDLEAVIRLVVTRMVIRALSTPFGVRQETVGDTSLAYTDKETLYLTDADRALLDGFGPQAAFTIDQMPNEALTSEPSLVGAWVNRDGYAPGEVDPFLFPPPANPDPAEPFYSPAWPALRNRFRR